MMIKKQINVIFLLLTLFTLTAQAMELSLDDDFRITKMLADKGHVIAQYDLFEKFFFGIGIEKSAKNAFIYLKKAANQGEPHAQYRMGNAYLNGIHGYPKNTVRAFKFIELSAKNGYPVACTILAKIYQQGKIIKKNENMVTYWREQAKNKKAFKDKTILLERKFQALKQSIYHQEELKDKQANYLKAEKKEKIIPKRRIVKPKKIIPIDLQNYILLKQWYIDSDFAKILPSPNNQCRSITKKITCLSKELNNQYYKYKIKSIIKDFNSETNTLRIFSKKRITKITLKNLSDSSLRKGWLEKIDQYRCQLIDKKRLECQHNEQKNTFITK